MKKCVIVLAFISNSIMFSQTITGSLLGAEKDKIYQVFIKSKEEVIDKIESQNGSFLYKKPLKNGHYLIEVFDHEKSLAQKEFFFNQQDSQITIDLNHYKRIEEIVVHSNSMLELKSDRLIFNVASSVYKEGFTSLDALKKIPLVMEIDGKINMVGKGDIIFTINDRRVNFSETDLVEYLKTIPSENIEKIEVFTTPPAKYDSYGNGGVINIKLKKPKDELGVVVSSSYIQRSKPNYGDNVNFNYSKGKIALSLNVNYAESDFNTYYRYALFNANGNELLRSNENGENINHKVSTSLNLNYKLNAKVDAGFSYDYYNNKGNGNTFKRIDTNASGTNVDDELKTYNYANKHIWNSFTDLKLDSLGSKVSLQGSYILNTSSSANSLHNYMFDNDSKIQNTIYSFQGDLGLVRKKISVDVGFNVNHLKNNMEIKSPLDQSLFNYSEFIYNTYLDLNYTIDEKFSIKGSLKYEHWNRMINDIKIKNDYFFPTLNIAFKPNQKHTLTLAYARRLVQPYLSNLNPNRIYTTEKSYYSGNPYLSAYTIDNIDFRYALNNVLFFTVRSSLSRNVYGAVTTFDENNNERRTFENYYDSKVFGGNVSYLFRKWKWMDAQFFYDVFHVNAKVDPSFQARSGFVNVFYFDTSFYLKKDKSTFVSFSYFTSLPYHTVNNENRTVGNFNVNFKTNVIKDMLSLTISATDVFRQQGEKKVSFFSNGDHLDYYRYDDLRRVNLSLTYKFGKKKTIKKVNNLERIDG